MSRSEFIIYRRWKKNLDQFPILVSRLISEVANYHIHPKIYENAEENQQKYTTSITPGARSAPVGAAEGLAYLIFLDIFVYSGVDMVISCLRD